MNGVRLKSVWVAACLVAALFQTQVRAAVVFQSGEPDLVDGVNIGIAIVADDFVLRYPSVISGVRFWTIEDAGQNLSSIRWAIIADTGAGPSTESQDVIAESTAVIDSRRKTGRQSIWIEFENAFSLDQPVLLDAGRSYWLAMASTELDPFATTPLWWETSAASVGDRPHVMRLFSAATQQWETHPALAAHDLAFELTGTAVPEPCSNGAIVGCVIAATLTGVRRNGKRSPRSLLIRVGRYVRRCER